MSKKWTEFQLNKIYTFHPELRLVPLMKIDDVVVEFLKIHEVEARPPKDTSKRDGAIAGAITGMAGADVGGDTFLIQGQNKQAQLQEWTSWKQWSLSHKDFQEFKNKLNAEAITENTEIEKKLYAPEFIEKWEAKLKKDEEEGIIRKRKEKAKQEQQDTNEILRFIGFFVLFFAGIAFIASIQSNKGNYQKNSSRSEVVEIINV
tara:strand:- start:140 stop:751 length:612 start_codon:yes stop_codon:yes gene_type:complete